MGQETVPFNTLQAESLVICSSILLLTHDAAVASKAQRVVFLKDGIIVDQLEKEITVERIRAEMDILDI